MLTPEQTALRLRDSEIARLRAENEKLTSKLRVTRSGLADVFEKYITYVDESDRAELRMMIDQLRAAAR